MSRNANRMLRVALLALIGFILYCFYVALTDPMAFDVAPRAGDIVNGKRIR